MKPVLASIIFLLSLQASAQHYYKDIVGTRETAEMMRNYRNNKISRVVLTSFDENNAPITDFLVEQAFTGKELQTRTKSDYTHESLLVSTLDEKGNVLKTIDSSDIMVSTTTYEYNSNGQLTSALSITRDSSGKSVQAEQHVWEYRNGQISRMLRIKNKVDTTFVTFKLDENGNPSEEVETRKGISTEPVYYYYNSGNQITDIVRYNKKAKRLLPEYMFEYNSNGQVVQKITVPANSDNYLIWRFLYNAQGLKTKEAIYNKKKELTGKVEYQYYF